MLFLWRQPTELEQEIRLDLIAAGKIDETAKVEVFQKLDFLTFHQPPHQQFVAIVGIRQGDDFFLAQARCSRRGRRWHTDRETWRAMTVRPTTAEARAFLRDQPAASFPPMLLGYLPRPADKEDFRVNHLSIRLSNAPVDYDPNRGIDPAMFAALLRHEVRYTGQSHFNPCAFAAFHEPRWIAPRVGIEEAGEYVEFLKTHCGQAELAGVDCEPLIETLELVIERLEEIDQLGLKFHLLARQEGDE